ncbi:MAG: hypothetical protein HY868_21825 [Chloroflexi bacterium]|nr:hypothetical protein [Chloroflexota bacterium]
MAEETIEEHVEKGGGWFFRNTAKLTFCHSEERLLKTRNQVNSNKRRRISPVA